MYKNNNLVERQYMVKKYQFQNEDYHEPQNQ